jgi:uncharacterized protein YndB with AHSA1/START domain
MNDYGVKTAPDTLRIERTLPGPIERVWSYLTDPGKRATWFARGPMELKPGGRVELEFEHGDFSDEPYPDKYRKYKGVKSPGKILQADAPRLLVFAWGEEDGSASEVRFELSERGKDVHLVLTHSRLSSREAMLNVAGGWHAHLAVLADRLNGVEPKGFWSTIQRAEAEYARRIPA